MGYCFLPHSFLPQNWSWPSRRNHHFGHHWHPWIPGQLFLFTIIKTILMAFSIWFIFYCWELCDKIYIIQKSLTHSRLVQVGVYWYLAILHQCLKGRQNPNTNTMLTKSLYRYKFQGNSTCSTCDSTSRTMKEVAEQSGDICCQFKWTCSSWSLWLQWLGYQKRQDAFLTFSNFPTPYQ